MLYLLKKFFDHGLLLTKSPKVLNLRISKYIISSNDKFFIFDYQKAAIKLFKFMYILSNLFIYNKKFIVSNFQKSNEINMIYRYKSFLINNDILTSWYPGFLSNQQQLANYSDVERFNFLSASKPNFLLNFGRLVSKSLYREIETIPTVFLTTLDADEPVNNYCYFLPLNTASFKEAIFFFLLISNIFNKAQHISCIFRDAAFLQLKYKLYNKELVKKLKMQNEIRIFNLMVQNTRQNLLLKNYIKKKVLKVKKMKDIFQKPKESLIKVLSIKTKRKKTIFLKNSFQSYYYKFYYNNTVNTKYNTSSSYMLKRKLRSLLKSAIVINKRFKSQAKTKLHELEKSNRFARIKQKNKNFYIESRYYRYRKDRNNSLYIGYIFKQTPKRKQKTHSRKKGSDPAEKLSKCEPWYRSRQPTNKSKPWRNRNVWQIKPTRVSLQQKIVSLTSKFRYKKSDKGRTKNLFSSKGIKLSKTSGNSGYLSTFKKSGKTFKKKKT